MRRRDLLMAVTAPLLPVLAAGRSYLIEPEQDARLELFVAKTGLLAGKRHHFVFARYSGRLEYDHADPSRSQVELFIDAASLQCRDTWVSPADQRKITSFALEDMLAAKQYPEIRFRSSSITALTTAEFFVEGVLAIRGREHPAQVKVRLRESVGLLVFEGEAALRLKQWNLKLPTAALGLIGTKDEMEFHFRLLARPA